MTLGGCGYYNEVCNDFDMECGCADGTVLEGGTTWLGIMVCTHMLPSFMN